MFWGLALLFMLMMRLFPDTPFARRLRELLVDIPLKRLATLQRHHAIFFLLIIGLTMAGSEAALIFGNADLFLTIALYYDGFILSLALSALSSMKGVPGGIHARMIQLRRRLARQPGASHRRQRPRQRPAQRASDNDDDHARPAFQMAA